MCSDIPAYGNTTLRSVKSKKKLDRIGYNGIGFFESARIPQVQTVSVYWLLYSG
jgi:hypothetical protein